MALYQLKNSAYIIRTSDGANIPNDPLNADWQAYQLWLGDGNIPDAAITIPIDYIGQAQKLIDESDITLLRCLENGITVPSAWVIYRTSLRQVIAGNSSTLPTKPTYPAGS